MAQAPASSPTTTGTQHARIAEYYEDAGLDYGMWSDDFNMHFGYYRRGQHPFRLEPMLEQMNDAVQQRLQLGETAEPIVLDLGCGVGASCRSIARRHPAARVYGVSITPWQVRFGRERTAAQRLDERVQLIEGDFAALPLEDASVDAAFAIESACYASGADKGDLIDELARVLRPGGRFVITDGFRKGDHRLPGWLARTYQRNLRCWVLSELAEIGAFTQRLRRSGFEQLRIEPASLRVAPSFFLHVPYRLARFFAQHWWQRDRRPLSSARLDNLLAPPLAMLMGVCRRHFAYYIVSGRLRA